MAAVHTEAAAILMVNYLKKWEIKFNISNIDLVNL